MNYVTIYNTRNESEVVVIEQLFRQRQIEYRIINEPANNPVLEGKKVQVRDGQVDRAKGILKENGILGAPKPEPDSKETTRFWWFLLVALLAVILVSVLINWFL